jgi:hypothetical protein
MKILMRILMALSLGMVVFNAVQIDWQDPLTERSDVAVIGVMAALCAFLLLLLLMLSKKISKKIKS